jgi:hypothetical protein
VASKRQKTEAAPKLISNIDKLCEIGHGLLPLAPQLHEEFAGQLGVHQAEATLGLLETGIPVVDGYVFLPATVEG